MGNESEQPRPRRVAGCYAADLGDCDGKLSGEHWISASVLRLLLEGRGVPIRGLPWLQGDVRSLSIPVLQSKILCEYHNNSLSPLDTAGLAWASSMGLADEGVSAAADVIDGHRFERWMLKLLCGLAYSGNAGRSGVAIRGWSPPVEWLRILFGHRPCAPGVGLYTAASPPRHMGPYLAATPIGTEDTLIGIVIHVPGHALMLACEPPPPSTVQGAVYRPVTMHRTSFIWSSRDRGEAWSRWYRRMLDGQLGDDELPRPQSRRRRRPGHAALFGGS